MQKRSPISFIMNPLCIKRTIKLRLTLKLMLVMFILKFVKCPILLVAGKYINARRYIRFYNLIWSQWSPWSPKLLNACPMMNNASSAGNFWLATSSLKTIISMICTAGRNTWSDWYTSNHSASDRRWRFKLFGDSVL